MNTLLMFGSYLDLIPSWILLTKVYLFHGLNQFRKFDMYFSVLDSHGAAGNISILNMGVKQHTNKNGAW